MTGNLIEWPAIWTQLRELCTDVRQLLITLDFKAGDIVEAAQRVEAEHGGAMGIAYLKVRRMLEVLGQDIDQKDQARRDLEKQLHFAARYRNPGPWPPKEE